MRTDVVVKALSESAKVVLLRNKAEEEDLKRKYGTVVGVFRLKRLPSETQKHVTARLLTQHAFYDAKEDGMFCHRIIGRTIFNDREKAEIYEKIKEKMLEDGLVLDDFSVRFYDEQ